LDDVGYIHRGQCCYVHWCFGVVRSEQVKCVFFASAAILTQYVEICLIAYRFAVEVRLVYETLSAIELVLNYPMVPSNRLTHFRTVTRVVPKTLATAEMPNFFAYLTISSLTCILLLDIGTVG